MENNAISYAIGVDVGGTKIACGVVDNHGKLYAHQELRTLVEEGAKAVEEQILNAISTLCQQSNLPISGVGIGVAGQVDGKTGSIVFAPNLYWHNVPLCANIQKALNLPVCCLNDVRASTLAEWHYGEGKEISTRGCYDCSSCGG